MRLPLLVVSTPSLLAERCAVAFLPQGKWAIKSSGQIDSDYYLTLNGSPLKDDNNIIDGPANVEVCFKHKGKEKSLTIFAEKINGS